MFAGVENTLNEITDTESYSKCAVEPKQESISGFRCSDSPPFLIN